MKHARPDYDRIQDPALANPSLLQGGTAIAEDEPVFVLRAQDKHMTAMLMHYIDEVTKNPDYDIATVVSVYAHYDAVTKWQDEHGSKSPDMPSPTG